jgi:hypothetical protein
MASSDGAQQSRLPRRFDPMARAGGQVSMRRRSRDGAAQKLDAALPG